MVCNPIITVKLLSISNYMVCSTIPTKVKKICQGILQELFYGGFCQINLAEDYIKQYCTILQMF